MKPRIREYKYEWDVLYLKCTQCGERKTIDGYHKKNGRPFGVRAECGDCERKYVRANKEIVSNRYADWRDRNRKKIYEYKKEYSKTHIDKIRRYREDYYYENRNHILDMSSMYKKTRSNELWFNLPSFHGKARRYVNSRWLRPTKCPICWNYGNIDIHHPSYDKFDDWSKVVFCCRSCHQSIHSGMIECPEPINLLDSNDM